MPKFFSYAAAIAAALALHSPAHAACDQSGYIYSLAIDAAGTATLYLRTAGPAATLVYSFLVNDDKLLEAAIAAVPGRTRVQVSAGGTAVCSTGVGAPPIASYIFVTP
jgi:hypothetical protein